MKKSLFLMSLLAIGTFTAQAQISKGTALFGGNVGYSNYTAEYTSTNQTIGSSQREPETTNRSFNINPSGGLFVAENLAVGLTAAFGSQKSTSPYYSSWQGQFPVVREQSIKSSSFSVAPFLRYYYLPVETFGLYGQLSGGYQRHRSTQKVDEPGLSTQETKGNGAFVYVTPALVFFPNNKLGLELTMGSIGYTSTRSKPENLQQGQFGTETKTSNLGVNFGLSSLTLGASFYVGRQ